MKEKTKKAQQFNNRIKISFEEGCAELDVYSSDLDTPKLSKEVSKLMKKFFVSKTLKEDTNYIR